MKNLVRGTLLLHLITLESDQVLAQSNYRGGLFNYDTGDYEDAYTKAAIKSREKAKLNSLIVKKTKSGANKKSKKLSNTEKDDIKNASQFIH